MELNTLFKTIHSKLKIIPDSIQVIGIDGVDGVGKTTFAKKLQLYLEEQNLKVLRSSTDFFHNPQRIRYRLGKSSPEGFFKDSYNYSALREYLLDPLKLKRGKVILKYFDVDKDEELERIESKTDGVQVFIFEGLFLHRKEIVNYWDFSIFLKANFCNTYKRMSLRDGCSEDPRAISNKRYFEGQQIYLKQYCPEKVASLVIDYNDLSNVYISRLE